MDNSNSIGRGQFVWRLMGPALLFSGSAIGTSHLVQSTRAGALYGLALVGVIVLAGLLKFPAFRFAVDYGHSTKRSIMSGYRELGLWAPLLFAATALMIMPIIIAALSMATAGISIVVFGVDLPVQVTGISLIALCATLLFFGGYGWLDWVNRVLVLFLVIATLITTILVLPKVEWETLGAVNWVFDPKAILFVIALAGFMPNALEASVAQSLWTAEAETRLDGGRAATTRDARGAFLIGYVLTMVLAVCFCIMGAGVMHAEGIAPESSATGFAEQVIGLYSSTLGEGAAVLAAIAALSAMFTTLLVALDIGARNTATTWQETFGQSGSNGFKLPYRLSLLALLISGGTIVFTLLNSFTDLLDLATSAAFVIAPVIALLNHLVVTRCTMPDEDRPSVAIKALNIAAIVIMTSLAAAYFML
ncbi:MAG: hypothetical protein ABJ239_03905 [Erythrobacter sp.]